MIGVPNKARLLTLIVVLSNVLGNLALSVGMKAQAVVAPSKVVALFKVFLTPMVLLGVGLLIVWLLSRMALMGWADLSYVLPVTSAGYVLSALVGRFVLDEEVSMQRWIGTAFITAGMILVSVTPHKTKDKTA